MRHPPAPARGSAAGAAGGTDLLFARRRRRRSISPPAFCRHLADGAGRRRRAVRLRQRLGCRADGARWPRCFRLRLAGTQARRRERSRPCLRRLFRLALSADLLVRRRRAVAAALRRRLCDLGSSPPSRPISSPIRAIIGDRIGYLLAAAFPAGVGEFHCRPERISHRRVWSAARSSLMRAATGAGRRPARAADLQAAPWLVVSDRAHRRRHWRTFATAAVVAVLMALRRRCSPSAASLACLLRQYRPHLAGVPFRRLGRLEQAANRVWPRAHARRQRDAGLDACRPRSRSSPRRRGGAVAKPRRRTRSRPPRSATGALLATPYLYMYDLRRAGGAACVSLPPRRTRGFLPHELPASVSPAC